MHLLPLMRKRIHAIGFMHWSIWWIESRFICRSIKVFGCTNYHGPKLTITPVLLYSTCHSHVNFTHAAEDWSWKIWLKSDLPANAHPISIDQEGWAVCSGCQRLTGNWYSNISLPAISDESHRFLAASNVSLLSDVKVLLLIKSAICFLEQW